MFKKLKNIIRLFITFGLLLTSSIYANSDWEQAQKIVDGDRKTYDYLGYSVSISGNYAVVGAYQEDEDASNSNPITRAGSAYVFKTSDSGASWSQVQKIVASDRAFSDNFGYSVSISGDYIVIGAFNEDEDADGNNTATNAGSAYIFKTSDSGSTWSQVQKIVAADRGIGDNFGRSVSVSGDYIVIGSFLEDEDVNGSNTFDGSGSAYIFKTSDSGDTWSQVQKIVSSDRASNDYFGYSVAISGDYIVVGAQSEDEDISGANILSNAGSAYIFKTSDSGATWSQVQKIVSNDRGVDDSFGSSVAISGNYVVVGANGEDEDANDGSNLNSSGSAYVFKTGDSGATWSQVQKIVSDDRASFDNFGYAVSISGDYIVIGSYLEDEDENGANNLSDSGSAYVFKTSDSGASWSQVQKIVSSDRGSGDTFGRSVAISGNYIIVGANEEDEDAAGNNTIAGTGAAYIFNKTIVNNAPIIAEGTESNVTMSEDASPTPFSLTLNATDAENDTITWSIDTNASNGSASVSSSPTGLSQVINYSPTANYNGTDSFIVKASDGTLSDTITVNVTIDAVDEIVNATPTSSNINTTIQVNTTKTFIASDFSFTDSDSGDSLEAIVIVSTPSEEGILNLDGASVSANQSINISDIGNLVYTPNEDSVGTAQTIFTFKVNDGTNNSSETYTITINVTVDPVVTPVPDTNTTTPVITVPTLQTIIPDQLVDVNNTALFDTNLSNYFTNATTYNFQEVKVDNNISDWLSIDSSNGKFSINTDDNISILGKYFIKAIASGGTDTKAIGYFTLRVKDLNASLSDYITSTGIIGVVNNTGDENGKQYAETNATISGQDISVKVYDDGSSRHNIQGVSEATSMLPDSKVKMETNGDVNTTTSTINGAGEQINIEVLGIASGDIKAQHSITLEDGNITKAISKIANTITTIKTNRVVETNATISSHQASALANPDGTSQHSLTIGSAVSKAISYIKGATTTLSDSGIDTAVIYSGIQYLISTDAQGETVPKKAGVELIDTTTGDKLSAGSIVTIKDDGTIELNTTIPTNGLLKIKGDQ